MTKEELKKELEITQKALEDTQKAMLTLAEAVYRTKAVLQIHSIIDDLDSSYIKGELSDDEYKERYKEQNSLTNLFSQQLHRKYNQMFNVLASDEEGSPNED